MPDSAHSLEQLRSEVEQLAQPISDLREALVDEADSKNLLDKQDIPALRQADAAIDIVDQVQEQTESSLDSVPNLPQPSNKTPLETQADNQASNASSRSQTSEALSLAAEEQKDASKALQELAQLLDPTEEELDPAAMQELASNRTGQPLAEISEQYSDLYDTAERLALLADTNPAEVLKALEQQLPKNPEMQNELSEISKQAAQQALENLDHAANQQEEIEPRLENSDVALREKKNLLLHDLSTARTAISQMTQTYLSEALRTAQTGKQSTQSQEINETIQELARATAEAADAKFESSHARTASHGPRSIASIGSSARRFGPN